VLNLQWRNIFESAKLICQNDLRLKNVEMPKIGPFFIMGRFFFIRLFRKVLGCLGDQNIAAFLFIELSDLTFCPSLFSSF